ncbi:MAG: hypothetical protein NTZ05_16240 [Chloroflexi bacterium]|nr:hypothetical protein [Chloroflexota bacterium]
MEKRHRKLQFGWAIIAAATMAFSSTGGAFAQSASNVGFVGNDICIQNTGGSYGGNNGGHDNDCGDDNNGGSHGGNNDGNSGGNNNGGNNNGNNNGGGQFGGGQGGPSKITVSWKGGPTATVNLDHIANKVAYYKTTANLGKDLNSVSAKIDEDWRGSFEVDYGPCAVQIIDRSGTSPINFTVDLPCGPLTFNGTLKWSQHFEYNERTGTLKFAYKSTTKGTGTLDDDTYIWNNVSNEFDTLDLRGTAGKTGFNADGTPNLDPYSGSLVDWLADNDNLQHVIFIKLEFKDALYKQGSHGKASKKPVLLNTVLITANAQGIQDYMTQYASCLCK